ncbi:MAG: acylphosphatase [Euryarchaeota archaeon]|nr:acylphosphatase [Euryarchaeota archaeon]
MKIKIIIRGDKVHGIGYRYFMMENAMALGVERFGAVNLVSDKEVVQIIAEGEEDVIGEFCKFARANFPRDATVDRIDMEDYRGCVPKIETFALVFNIGQTMKFIEDAKMVVETTIKDESGKAIEDIVALGTIIKEESEKTRGEMGVMR